FWALVLQCSLISLSIAAGSLLLATSILLLVLWSIKERRWIVPRTSLDYFFLAYCIFELASIFISLDKGQSLYFSKRLLLISIVYGVVASFSSKKKIEQSMIMISSVVAILSVIEIFF